MSKTIYIVRHAKSSWADLSLSDKERPLNQRGHRDAPTMAQWCLLHSLVPDMIISSTAMRAATTAEYFAAVLEIDAQHINVYDSLYHAPAQQYLEMCYGLSNDVDSVMMFGHNPGITYLANEVSSTYIDNVPTCGVLVIDYSGQNWQDLDISKCSLRSLYTPKSIRNA